MKKILLSAVLLMAFLLTETQAQEVAKRIVVEHFTNTRCGVCSNRNPGFFANLANHPDVLHMAVHPSSPYPTCELNMHNAAENDSRTNYYGVYGGTPRLVIQGSPISAGSNYNSASIFEEHQNQTTPISLRLVQTKEDNNISVQLIVKAEASNEIGTANLFLAAVEELLEFNAPNGENEHHNVFRKTMNAAPQGESIDIPAVAGDSITLSYTVAADAAWNYEQMYVMAILNDASTKAVIQATASDPADNETITSTREINTIAAQVFPNPVKDQVQLKLAVGELATATLYSTQGALVTRAQFDTQTTLNVADLATGVYYLHIETATGIAIKKMVKK